MLASPNFQQTLPDHTQLPESDGTFVKNFQEHPQSMLLTDCIEPVLQQRHPDGQYCIGQDCGIYWRMSEPPEPPERGAEAPDWFYVPHVPPMLNGKVRRSYVLWQEYIAPLIVLEFVSGDGSEERDRTRMSGKFWIYEQVIRAPFYAIYEVSKPGVELYHLVEGQYLSVPANDRGHYAIAPLGVELGIWQGQYQNGELPWLRWWDLAGNLLPTSSERAELANQKAELANQRAELANQKAARLAAQLQALGIEPEI